MTTRLQLMLLQYCLHHQTLLLLLQNLHQTLQNLRQPAANLMQNLHLMLQPHPAII